jgi:hypothetical protein
MTSPMEIVGIDIDANGKPLHHGDPNEYPFKYRFLRILIIESAAITVSVLLMLYNMLFWGVLILFSALPAGLLYLMQRRHYAITDSIHM